MAGKMGNMIGKVYNRFVIRPLKNFNLENRAQKVLEKSKVRAAPRHPSVAPKLEEFSRSHPEILKEQKKKPLDLLERLKVVSVSSQDSAKKIEEQVSQRPLPQDRKEVPIYDFGFKQPDKVPIGKVSFKDFLDILSNHQRFPKEWTAEHIAKEYKLDIENTRQILKHFQLLNVYTPEKPQPPRLRERVTKSLTGKT